MGRGIVAAASGSAPRAARTGTLALMWPRLSIVVGLLAGVAVAGLVLGGILFLGPVPTPPPFPTPDAIVPLRPRRDAAPTASGSAVAHGQRLGRACGQRLGACPRPAARPRLRLSGSPAPASPASASASPRGPAPHRRARRRTSWLGASGPSCPASTSSRDRRGLDAGRDRRHARAARRRPPPLLVVADFDGTLASPSRDPAAARIEPGAQRALRRLAGIAARRPIARPRRDPDRPDRAGRRVPGARRRHRVPRRPRAPVGDPRPRRASRVDRRGRRAGLRRSRHPGRGAGAPASPTSWGARRGCSSSARGRRSRSTSARPTTCRPPGPRSWPPSRRSRRARTSATMAWRPYRGRSVVDLRPRGRGRQARGRRAAARATCARRGHRPRRRSQ